MKCNKISVLPEIDKIQREKTSKPPPPHIYRDKDREKERERQKKTKKKREKERLREKERERERERERVGEEGRKCFNDALNTFYLWLYGVRHMVKDHSDSCRHMGYSFRLAAMVLLYASSHRQDKTYHSLCYTSCGALAGTRNSSMGSS